jgi:hypothetical protein
MIVEAEAQSVGVERGAGAGAGGKHDSGVEKIPRERLSPSHRTSAQAEV